MKIRIPVKNFQWTKSKKKNKHDKKINNVKNNYNWKMKLYFNFKKSVVLTIHVVVSIYSMLTQKNMMVKASASEPKDSRGISVNCPIKQICK